MYYSGWYWLQGKDGYTGQIALLSRQVMDISDVGASEVERFKYLGSVLLEMAATRKTHMIYLSMDGWSDDKRHVFCVIKGSHSLGQCVKLPNKISTEKYFIGT